jgi:hypothetical protein
MSQLASFDRSLYNSLPGVEEVDRLVRSSGKLEMALATLGSLFVRHNMCDKWGLSILHSHWFVDAGQTPLQEALAGPEGKEFVTMPRVGPFSQPVWPSLFAVASGMLQPMEFSTDKVAQEANAALSESSFLYEFAATLTSLDLATTFGLILVREPEDATREFVEFNRDGSSVLRPVLSTEVDRDSLVQTSWRFAPDAVGASCQASCFQTCTVSDSGHIKNPHQKLHRPGE